MGWFIVARVALVAALAAAAATLRPVPVGGRWASAVGGAVLGGLLVWLEHRLRDVPSVRLLGAVLGATIGLLLGRLIIGALVSADAGADQAVFTRMTVLLGLAYLGAVIGARRGEWLEPARLMTLFRSPRATRAYKILDTSVIIDGRIADICETGILDGCLVVPQFVLRELQSIADSSDTLKRNRGRRGLDILQRIQKMATVEVIVSDLDFPSIREVDLKLIELARALDGKIVTNDFNLNKVAQLRGIQVLNINELANALKPVVLPGEFMRVLILKEGKEFNQGVAYLDDGTMVVVDNARRLIGKTIDVVVTSVLQTTAGKMIFGRHIDPGALQPPAVAQPPQAQQRPGSQPSAAPSAAATVSSAPAAHAGPPAAPAGPAGQASAPEKDAAGRPTRVPPPA